MESTSHDATTALISLPSSAPSTPTPQPSGFRCQLSREHLLPALTLMQAIAEPRTSLPILSHVFLEARPHDTLELRATDLEIGLSRQCPATVKTAGACTADARRLYEIVRALPPGSLTLESSLAHGLTITQDKRRFRLLSLDPSEFPQLAPAGESVQTIELPATRLKELLDRTSFAVSPDDTRVHLHSLLFACGPDEQVRCAASDGHRLAIIARLTLVHEAEHQFRLPPGSVMEAAGIGTAARRQLEDLLCSLLLTMPEVRVRLQTHPLPFSRPALREIATSALRQTPYPQHLTAEVRRLASLVGRRHGRTPRHTPPRTPDTPPVSHHQR